MHHVFLLVRLKVVSVWETDPSTRRISVYAADMPGCGRQTGSEANRNADNPLSTAFL
jgi:hypothetical protein